MCVSCTRWQLLCVHQWFLFPIAGDVLFFHCNLLHCSDSNQSQTKRWVLISAYNRASNDPVYKHHHPCYTKLHKVTVVTRDSSYIVASNDPVYKHLHPCYTKLHKVTVVTRDTSYTVTGA